MKKFFLLILFTVFTANVFSQEIPKREFRGAWIATVSRIDWPSSTNPTLQKEQLINILDGLKESGINVVIFQIRPESDALYNSSIEPWSYWLTGSQGAAPNPYYDPLEFAIQEAHKRGMELHAWFNPYRVKVSSSNYPFAANHISNTHPEWVLSIGTDTVLDPGIADVRNYIVTIISDVVSRYDVDGVHMDDYFYPWAGITNEDSQTFANDPRGFSNIADWRRDNVNLLIKGIHTAINSINPDVKFGMSPFGIWKSGTPPGISGTSAWGAPLYCDAVAWMNGEYIDYLAPQLYWPFGGSQDYGKLLPWWASVMNGRHLYPGQAAYRVSTWSASEIPNQIKLNRQTNGVKGSIFFSTRSIFDNPKGLQDSLMNNYFKYKALLPSFDWKDQILPNPPQNLRFDRVPGTGFANLIWDEPQEASDGDKGSWYVVYKGENEFIDEVDKNDPKKIADIVGEMSITPKSANENLGSVYFTVTTLDRNHNESFLGESILVNSPDTPLLAYPEDNAQNQPDNTMLKWNYAFHSSHYNLQIAADQNFDNIVVNKLNVKDTLSSLTELAGQETYYWRVKAFNPAGESQYSNSRSFTTGFPVAPMLVFPANETVNAPTSIHLGWNHVSGADSYRIQIAKSLSILPETIVIDSSGLADTTFYAQNLSINSIYAWQVSAYNEYGKSLWSQTFKFLTDNQVGVDDDLALFNYKLEQNFPNPFNPTTAIKFSIPKTQNVSLKIYDVLGREIRSLLNEVMSLGEHTVNFNAEGLPSGIYIYVLRTESKVLTNKMMLLK